MVCVCVIASQPARIGEFIHAISFIDGKRYALSFVRIIHFIPFNSEIGGKLRIVKTKSSREKERENDANCIVNRGYKEQRYEEVGRE